MAAIDLNAASLTDLSAGKMDKSRSLFTQLLSKGYFYGEVAGIRLTSQIGGVSTPMPMSNAHS